MVDLEQKIQLLEEGIEKIKTRNKKVEKDKAWETSLTRKIFIALSTYILVSILMAAMRIEHPLLNAIVPAIAYLISTISLSVVKDWWLKKHI